MGHSSWSEGIWLPLFFMALKKKGVSNIVTEEFTVFHKAFIVIGNQSFKTEQVIMISKYEVNI